jgi:hypothetical protein
MYNCNKSIFNEMGEQWENEWPFRKWKCEEMRKAYDLLYVIIHSTCLHTPALLRCLMLSSNHHCHVGFYHHLFDCRHFYTFLWHILWGFGFFPGEWHKLRMMTTRDPGERRENELEFTEQNAIFILLYNSLFARSV